MMTWVKMKAVLFGCIASCILIMMRKPFVLAECILFGTIKQLYC